MSEQNKNLDEQEIAKRFQFTPDELRDMDETEFRARFRERIHHTLEIQTYACAYKNEKPSPSQADTVRMYMKVWKDRGLAESLPEYKTACLLLGFYESLLAGERVDLSAYAPYLPTESERAAFDKILAQRRSVRHWEDRRVADETIDALLEAGLWAAHSCNLQSIRYLVVREDNAPGLFMGSDIPGGPVHIVLLQDSRVYRANPFNPVRNRLLDCGAAAQNIVLTAHAHGLGGVWLTFNDTMIKRIRAHFDMPDHLDMVTYVDVGYGGQTPAPLFRWSAADCTFRRI